MTTPVEPHATWSWRCPHCRSRTELPDDFTGGCLTCGSCDRQTDVAASPLPSFLPREVGVATTLGELRRLLDGYPDPMPVAVDYDSIMDEVSVATRRLYWSEEHKSWCDPQYSREPVHESVVRTVMVLT